MVAPLKVALLGCGTVGSSVLRLMHEQAGDLSARIGAPLEVAGVAVRRAGRSRDVPVDPALFTTDAAGLVARDDVDIVVEVIGGIEPARTLILSALDRGRAVVTANKALLAEDGSSLYEAARVSHADLYYEAAVAGAIPLLRPIRESLAGDRIDRVLGIVNGTCNYILTQMDEHGLGFEEALDEATSLGYAEADPTADIEGFDAAAKAAILASLAFHTNVTAADVYREGIIDVSAADVASARENGCVVKLLAICERMPDGGGIIARVHPAMVPVTHPLATVRGPYNAVFIQAQAAGSLMFYGPGAGGDPTASAVLGDIVSCARNLVVGGRGPRETAYANLKAYPIGDAVTRYYVNLDVADRPGVLAQVATVFAANGVSIQTVKQQMRGSEARLVVVTHQAPEAALAATVKGLAELDAVAAIVSVTRVEGN